MVANAHFQVSAPGQFLFSIDLGNSGTQLMVGLNAVFGAVDIALQLRVAQVAQRINAADQLVVLKECLACAMVPGQSANLTYQDVLISVQNLPGNSVNTFQ